MVAFVGSVLVMGLLVAPVVRLMKRRPPDAPTTWGEAMGGAVYVFFIIFWVYGVVPHQFLAWADNDLAWRADRFMVGPGGILEALPFVVTYQVLRDITTVALLSVIVAGNLRLWSMWQARGTEEPEVPISTFGRPIVQATDS